MESKDTFPVIILDHELLGKVLTEYGHVSSNIPWSQKIKVTDVSYDEVEKILTAYIDITTEYVN